MNAVIVYGSHHHGNTEKLVRHLAARYPITLVDAEQMQEAELSQYDLVGFASGVDFGKFYPAVTELARFLRPGQKLFALYTCARDNKSYGEEIRQIAGVMDCTFLGKFGCKGYNTYGPWKLIGGMNKNRPSQEELAQAETFFAGILEKYREI